jgi:hypothetical protein
MHHLRHPALSLLCSYLMLTAPTESSLLQKPSSNTCYNDDSCTTMRILSRFTPKDVRCHRNTILISRCPIISSQVLSMPKAFHDASCMFRHSERHLAGDVSDPAMRTMTESSEPSLQVLQDLIHDSQLIWNPITHAIASLDQ